MAPGIFTAKHSPIYPQTRLCSELLTRTFPCFPDPALVISNRISNLLQPSLHKTQKKTTQNHTCMYFSKASPLQYGDSTTLLAWAPNPASTLDSLGSLTPHIQSFTGKSCLAPLATQPPADKLLALQLLPLAWQPQFPVPGGP